MLLWSFLLFGLYERADSNTTTTTATSNSTFPVLTIDGYPVVLAGEKVQLTCYGMHDVSWYRLDQATGRYHMVQLRYSLTFNATVESSGEYMCSKFNQPFKTYYSAVINVTVVEKISPLQLVATPDCGIAMEGQAVTMRCVASTVPPTVTWSWYKLEEQGGWQMVVNSTELTLTKVEESGKYRCHAQSKAQGIWQEKKSPNFTVYFIRLHATAAENVGIAAFCLSLLALIILFCFAILLWLGRQRANESAAQALTIPNTMAKGFAGPEKAQKGEVPKTEGDGEMYMNYTNTNKAYTDLDSNYMTGDDVYSSLS